MIAGYRVTLNVRGGAWPIELCRAIVAVLGSRLGDWSIIGVDEHGELQGNVDARPGHVEQ